MLGSSPSSACTASCPAEPSGLGRCHFGLWFVIVSRRDDCCDDKDQSCYQDDPQLHPNSKPGRMARLLQFGVHTSKGLYINGTEILDSRIASRLDMQVDIE